MSYRTEFVHLIDAYWRRAKVKPKPYRVSFIHPPIFSHIEYELYYLMNEGDSEYMMDWVALSFEKGVPVPAPPGKRLNLMEKRFRLHFLYNALSEGTSRESNSSCFSFFSWVCLIVFVIAAWYIWKWVKTYIQTLCKMTFTATATSTAAENMNTTTTDIPTVITTCKKTPSKFKINYWWYVLALVLVFLLK